MRMDTIGAGIEQIPVSINYDIIHLFSEGLYKSPHKAIEELVSNSYDAEAGRVHVLLPDAGDGTGPVDRLWVIDDGHGMDEDGFRQLWRVADSTKKNAPSAPGRRAPIGQFGIGKVDDSGEVIMHHTAEQIVSELERNIAGLMPEAEQIPETT